MPPQGRGPRRGSNCGRGQKKLSHDASNRVELLQDPTAHAEMQAIKKACAALGQKRLTIATFTLPSNLALCAQAPLHTPILDAFISAHPTRRVARWKTVHAFSNSPPAITNLTFMAAFMKVPQQRFS